MTEKKRVLAAVESHPNDATVEDQCYGAILTGEIIEEYPDDFPFPSCLILGFDESHRPIHTVVAYATSQKLAIIVTAYVPNPARWIECRTRRS